MGAAVCPVEVKFFGSKKIPENLNLFYFRDLEDTIEQTIGDKPKTNNFYAKDIVQQNSVSSFWKTN